MRAGAPYVVDDAEADPRVTPPDRAAYAQTQIRAVVCVPLHKVGRLAAAMAVHQRAPRRWAPEEVDLVVTVVQRCWESLERARAYRDLRAREAALRDAAARLAERTAAAEDARHAAEEARNAADVARGVAEEANRAKGEFLATMSHELRTPLNAIGGYAELLELGLRGPVTAEQREDLGRIRRRRPAPAGAHQRRAELRPDRGRRGALRPAGRVARRGGGRRRGAGGAAARGQGAGVLARRLRPDTPDRPHRVRADPEKVRQVLLNLLSNAIKFTAPGGRVDLACEVVRGGAPGAGGGPAVVRLRVRDTGRGIPVGRLAAVFEPFVQVDRDLTHASQQGVGLGLAISRDLARGMGGDLTVESTPGAGSTFTPHAARRLTRVAGRHPSEALAEAEEQQPVLRERPTSSEIIVLWFHATRAPAP
jgi:signal transduction histidine kinase